MKKCILVYSMPRSGSSCLTGCLHLCGCFLGDGHDKAKHKEFNPKGFFENINIYNFNKRMIKNLKWSVFSQLDITDKQKKSSMQFVNELHNIIKDEFANHHDMISVKDPRIVPFTDLWSQSLKQAGFEVQIVVLWRQKECVNQSLKHFRQTASEHYRTDGFNYSVYSMYERMFNKILHGDNDTYEIHFEDLYDDPVTTLKPLCQWANLNFTTEIQDKLIDFVDSSLVHFKRNK